MDRVSGASDHVPTVSVVMPTFDRARTIAASVEPLLVDGNVLEVVVVDDGSTDDTKAVLHRLRGRFPALRPISVENGGAARARQIGVEAAKGDVVLIMDDDVIAAPGLALGHARHHSARSDLLVLGYMPTTIPDQWTRGQYATYIYASSYEDHCVRWESDPTAILHRVWAGNLSMRRTAALRVGMSATVSGYHADRDFGLRCERAGITAVFDRDLRATHRHQRTLRQFRADSRSQGASSFDLYAAHADVLGQFDDEYRRHPSAFVRGVVGSARFTPLHRVVGACLAVGVQSAGAFHAASLEMRAALLLGRIEGERGYIDRSRSADYRRSR